MSFILTIAVYTGRGTAVADAAALAQKCGPGLNNMWDAESKVKISTEERAMESHKMAMFETRTKQLEMLLGMPYLSDDERLRVQQELFKHVMGGLSMPSAKSNASTWRKRAASQALDGSDDDDEFCTPRSNNCRASLQDLLGTPASAVPGRENGGSGGSSASAVDVDAGSGGTPASAVLGRENGGSGGSSAAAVDVDACSRAVGAEAAGNHS